MSALLRAEGWIERLPATLRRAVEARCRLRELADGEAVYASGDAARECYAVVSGRVRITDYSSAGREFQVEICAVGDTFGELSLIDGLPRAENAYASGPTSVLVLSSADFADLRSKHAALERHLSLHLCARIRALSAALKEASTLPLSERLPRLLGRLAISHGSPGSASLALIDGVSHSDLANMLGVTRQSVSRELKALERGGWIELRYRRIVISDLAALGERFGSERLSAAPVASSE